MTDDSLQHASAVEQVPDRILTPEFHLDVLDDLVYPAECRGAVPLASSPDNRYPYAYPRDIASITRAWLAAVEADVRPDDCKRHVVDAAKFLLAVHGEDGAWQQRYALDGMDKSIYIQEDNTGHGLRVLAHALIALDETDSVDAVDDDFSATATEAVERAVAFVRDELYDPNAQLIESTTSIHEGRIESGYTLWVNCTFVAALRRTVDALSTLRDDTPAVVETIEEFRTQLEGGVKRAFTSTQHVPRRYSPTGDIDTRPDITLLAPYYFGLEDLFGESAEEAAERAVAALDDPELGGLQRFLGFYRDYDVQQHGGNGPWMQYTAWHAQYRFDRGDIERGDAVLETIARYADGRGHIPEHLTTRARFESFMENEWHTRRDFEKEFDEDVLRDVPFDLVVEELGHMKDAYRDLADQTTERNVVSFALPLAWSHAEFLTALLRRANAVRRRESKSPESTSTNP
ncbi:glucoamylase [Haladaptatus halobius]|uniref:glucoamylase n=1 Tax=Haladaptatus halobius TaxID=2884875 RepID=UPI001D0B408D|nr:glucoamylase [Haladaptatus halobius]